MMSRNPIPPFAGLGISSVRPKSIENTWKLTFVKRDVEKGSIKNKK